MSQTQAQKESKDETKKKAAQQSGTAILPFLSALGRRKQIVSRLKENLRW